MYETIYFPERNEQGIQVTNITSSGNILYKHLVADTITWAPGSFGSGIYFSGGQGIDLSLRYFSGLVPQRTIDIQFNTNNTGSVQTIYQEGGPTQGFAVLVSNNFILCHVGSNITNNPGIGSILGSLS